MTNDQMIALDWISTIESDKSRVRETDIYPMLDQWVKQAAPKTIIEIGCGQGICSNNFDLDSRSYIGIDPSEILINRAKELYSNSNRIFVLGNAYAIPFSDEAFDAAFSISVWHLLDDLKKAAEELSRILKSQGHFLIISSNPSAYSLWEDLYVDTKLVGKRLEGKIKLKDESIVQEALYLHTLDEITKSLEESGLIVLNIETFRSNLFVSISGKKI